MIILLVVGVVYLLIKIYQFDNNNKREDFYVDSINSEALNNLAKISENIIKDDTLVIPSNLNVMGTNNIIPKGIIIYYDLKRPIPKGWALCNGNYAYINKSKDGETGYIQYVNGKTAAPNRPNILTPHLRETDDRSKKGDDANYCGFIIKIL